MKYSLKIIHMNNELQTIHSINQQCQLHLKRKVISQKINWFK